MEFLRILVRKWALGAAVVKKPSRNHENENDAKLLRGNFVESAEHAKIDIRVENTNKPVRQGGDGFE